MLQYTCYIYICVAEHFCAIRIIADVELNVAIDVGGIVAGAALQAELAANAIVTASSMFTFAFSSAVLAENQEAIVAAFTASFAAREG